MTFQEAREAMFNGSKVRLSDWMGFWFIPGQLAEMCEGHLSDDYIRVFTRDGDILDTPNIDRYKNRDDWEIYDHKGWSFDMAFRFIKNGKKVQRSNWHKDSWISLNDIEEEFIFRSDDMLESDWEIVNE